MAEIEALRAQHKKGVVVGLKDALGVRPRVDIDVLMRDEPKTFNLFILAMQDLMTPEKSSELFGYYQIAGIHGLPKYYWDGVQGKRNVEGNISLGYCEHGTVLFPTWHRPYLAMLEQALFLSMYDLAGKYTNETEKKSYQEAAKKFRLPYWDYFRPRGGKVTFPGVIQNGLTTFPYDYSAPALFTQNRIQVRMWPDNKHLVITNPFYSFTFPKNPDVAIREQDWRQFGFDPQRYPRDKTVRYPAPRTAGWSSEQTMNVVLNAMRMDACRLFLNMMEDQTYFSYDEFATQQEQNRPPSNAQTQATRFIWGASGSLEALHGTYHGLIGGDAGLPRTSGGGGHMSSPGIAAFDPIFWFHHCQIDRWLAIWQSATQGKAESWFNTEFSQQLANSPLLPSRKARGAVGDDFWTSNMSRKTEDFGYVYEDAAGSRDQVLNRLHGNYNWSVALNQANPQVTAPTSMQPIDVKSSDFFAFNTGVVPPIMQLAAVEPAAFAAATTEAIVIPASIPAPEAEPVKSEPATVSEGTVREWFIDDRVQRLALNGAFSIYYFISPREDGKIPENESPTDFVLDPALAGITHIFAAPVEHCDSCNIQNRESVMVTNTTAITSFLLDYVSIGQLADMEPENVSKFLEARLKWRIVKVNGEKVDPRFLANEKTLQINISCKNSQLPRNSGIATYEEYPDIIQHIISNASSDPSS